MVAINSDFLFPLPILRIYSNSITKVLALPSKTLKSMEARRTSIMVIDPKVRQVGFVTFTTDGGSPPPDWTGTSANSPAADSLSPVMIPPPQHASDNISSSCAVPVDVPMSTLRGPSGNYDLSESFSDTFPSLSSKNDGDFFQEDDMSSNGWMLGGNPGKLASSYPGSGFSMASESSFSPTVATNLITASALKGPISVSGYAFTCM